MEDDPPKIDGEYPPLVAPASILDPGALVAGRYRVDRILGRGGMGIVYLAYDEHLSSRRVVLKLLLDAADPWQTRKFDEERIALSRVTHPSVVKPLDSGKLPCGRPYLVMEFVDGQPLGCVMRGLSNATLGEVCFRVGDAVSAVHEEGVLHRDLNPQNIMFQRLASGEPRVVILDFGIASLRASPGAPPQLTVAAGTIGYMAPEQLLNSPTEGSDIYAIGVIAYEALTGRLPFPITSVIDLYEGQKTGLSEIASVHNLRPNLPKELDGVIRQALAFDPQQRQESARLLGQQLRAVLGSQLAYKPEPDDAKPPSWGGPLPLPPADPGATEPSPLALIDTAFEALRDRDAAQAKSLLARAASLPGADAPQVQGRIAQCRGTALYNEGKYDLALRELTKALSTFRGVSPEGAASTLDLIGMVYAAKNDFHAARGFHTRAMELSEECGDKKGVATGHGQLGRLYLAWGYVDQAEKHFEQDLNLAAQLQDGRAVALMNNHIGQVCMARKRWSEAATYLDRSIDQSEKGGWLVKEGYARKDRALTHLECDELGPGQFQLDLARDIFRRANFAEGSAHVAYVQGRICAQRREWDEGERQLAAAIAGFGLANEPAEVARAQFQMARLRGARGMPSERLLLEALAAAERTRREGLIREIESELAKVSLSDLLRRELRRARGYDAKECETSLQEGKAETASIIFLDLEGSTELAKRSDPAELMATLNQLMAELVAHLDRRGGAVTAYLGDGFMALVRGQNHAVRAVDAAIDMNAAVGDFNAPRELLGHVPLRVRVGVSTGEVFIGNVGTYSKMDFTAIGAAVNLAARLQAGARPGAPAISGPTHEVVEDQFDFASDSPRTVLLKGLGNRQVWDVIGPRAGRTFPRTGG